MVYNPYAIYVHCDGAMNYDSDSSGGVGYVIMFPEVIEIEPISASIGKYVGANIERLELEAIIQGMEELLRLFKTHSKQLRKANQIILCTDRFALNDQDRTNPYRIKEWRKNNWHNHEGKPIKNSDLLDKLDKTRKKLVDNLHCRVNIEYERRKKHKPADKLAKAGKSQLTSKENIAIKGTKTARKLFDGSTVDYKRLKPNEEIIIHIYRKEPVKVEWEVFAEICKGENQGKKVKIYANDGLATRLQRQHIYRAKIRHVFRYHIHIYSNLYDYKKKSKIIISTNE